MTLNIEYLVHVIQNYRCLLLLVVDLDCLLCDMKIIINRLFSASTPEKLIFQLLRLLSFKDIRESIVDVG